jgi:glucokinase
MARTIGVLAAEHIAVGAVEDGALAGPLRVFPESDAEQEYLTALPVEEITERIQEQIALAADGAAIEAVGIGFPGIIRDGLVEESPNLKQAKGVNLAGMIASLLESRDIAAPVFALNDADAMAAGIAATRGHLDQTVRVWTLGVGVGFGRYPLPDGPGEGGHIVVTLDPKEKYCGCGGIGHVEGIVGHRSMRLRFLDLEPEEVFAQARTGDARCDEFVRLWHRALAAAIATAVHMDGPGKFFVSGPNARYVELDTLYSYLHEMVKMSPLQDNTVEVVSTNDEVAIIGAAISASQAAARG